MCKKVRKASSQSVRQAVRQADRQADRQAGRQTDRQAGRQTGRQAGRQTDRQTGRQTGRMKSREKDSGSNRKIHMKIDSKRAIEAGGIRGLAVKCLDITKNHNGEGSLLNCNLRSCSTGR